MGVDISAHKRTGDEVNIALLEGRITFSEAVNKYADLLKESSSIEDLIAFEVVFTVFTHLADLNNQDKIEINTSKVIKMRKHCQPKNSNCARSQRPIY